MFILMVVLITHSPRPVSLTAEFSSQAKCEEAGKAITDKFLKMRGGTYSADFVCMPK